MTTNLPRPPVSDSAESTKLFFDTYGQSPLEFNATEVDACIAFFTNTGFDNDASLTISSVILKQAKLEGLPVFRILDTIKKLDNLKLSALVSEILNNNRSPTSTLGYRSPIGDDNKAREVSA